MTKTVVLTVGLSADAGETVTVYNALETLTFRSTDNVAESHTVEDVSYREFVAKLEFSCEIALEFDELAHGSNSCLFEMPLKRLAGVLFGGFAIGKLHGFIAIFLKSAQLRDNTRTSLDDGAWNILSISTENGSHSDFLSN